MSESPSLFEVDPRAASYYTITPGAAVEVARERIEEWDYDSDPHGYCHDRPILVVLVQEAERSA